MTARNFHPLLKEFADHLKDNGKKSKQIIIAVMRKLLHQIYGILKSGEPFNLEREAFKLPEAIQHSMEKSHFRVAISTQHLVLRLVPVGF